MRIRPSCSCCMSAASSTSSPRARCGSRRSSSSSPSTERHYQLQDATINARGIRLDRAFAEAAKDLAIRERTAINLKLQELTHGTITSVDQTKRFLTPSTRAATT